MSDTWEGTARRHFHLDDKRRRPDCGRLPVAPFAGYRHELVEEAGFESIAHAIVVTIEAQQGRARLEQGEKSTAEQGGPAHEGLAGLRPLARRCATQPRRQWPRPQHGGFHLVYDAIDWGFSMEHIGQKLPETSEKASERVRLRDEGYPLMTAQNAGATVERNALKRGTGGAVFFPLLRCCIW